MATSLCTALEDKPSGSDINAIVHGLLAFNQSHTNGATPEYLVATVRDGEGKLVGGVVAAAYVSWLQVSALWLQDELRGQGYGSALMALIEEAAIKKGCANAFLETFDFQALPFYEKRGYTVFSRLPDFPPGGARYALTKALQAGSAD
ncbi:GNAT family N-acetyltransferase [Dyella halodurans]|uniref:GNAT family N-acetyltransferase n=1 Tax=Dyella halodurans TaxID=1920171 RepID=A0ABV9C017_9GAMM|nr:GNAT family N-acetyltransferase [Dyella halodurans]